MDFEERLIKLMSIIDITHKALIEHMELIEPQALKNSAKGDEYWAVYSKGVHVNALMQDFVNTCMMEDAEKLNKH